MGICRWEWFDFRRLPFEDAFLNRRNSRSRSSSSRRKQEEATAFWRCLFPRASERRFLPIVGACKTSSHLHIFSSSHPLIFTSSHLHIFSSSHPLIFTSSHLHIFSSSHPLIFTSSHLHIFTSSHLHIFSSSHLLILPSSPHLLIFSHLLTSSHIFSHLLTSSHIFSSLHLLISHLLLLPSCPLALLPSCPLLLFYFFLEGGSRGSGNETARNATLSHEMRFDLQKLR